MVEDGPEVVGRAVAAPKEVVGRFGGEGWRHVVPLHRVDHRRVCRQSWRQALILLGWETQAPQMKMDGADAASAYA